MEFISRNDYQKILAFMDRVNLSTQNFREQVLLAFQELFGYCQSNFWLCDDDDYLVHPVSLNIDSRAINDYLTHYYSLDVLVPQQILKNSPKHLVARNLDLISTKQYEQSEFYNDFMQKYGYYHDIGMFLHNGKKIIGALNFVRPKREKPFDTSDTMCLEIISRFLTEKLNDPSLSLQQPTLTPKEKQVLELVQKGYTNKMISATLFISNNTVKRHLQNLYRKIGVSNRTSLSYKTLPFAK